MLIPATRTLEILILEIRIRGTQIPEIRILEIQNPVTQIQEQVIPAIPILETRTLVILTLATPILVMVIPVMRIQEKDQGEAQNHDYWRKNKCLDSD